MSAQPRTARDHGSALLVAIFLLLVVSLMVLGLLGHTFVVSRLAGAERWSVKALYAAESGANLAQARARVQALDGFRFQTRDLRGSTTLVDVGRVEVEVEPLRAAGAPRLVIGNQLNGGQGGGPALVVQPYRTRSAAEHGVSRTERVVAVVFGVGPMPATIPE